mgnify:CR=1 FL=1|tara:strand:+ start:1799 stop:2524 length:726 start_codon:yes stop_codon:yes gene_type:complete
MSHAREFKFEVDDALLDAGVTVGVIVIRDIDNRAVDPAFEVFRQARLDEILKRESLAALCAHPTLTAYRDLHAHFGVAAANLVPSPESLFHALCRYGGLRAINPIVDVYNLVALERRLSCGAHALTELNGAIRLRTTQGGESFTPLGAKKAQIVPTGEYAYVDGNERIVCRLECRQAAHSAVTASTRDVVVIVQGNAAVPAGDVELACTEIEQLCGRYVGKPGGVQRILVTPARVPGRQCA